MLRKHIIYLLLSLSLVTSLGASAENPVQIRQLSDYQEEQQLFLSAQIEYHLPAKLQEALHHEVRFYFRTEIEILDQLSWLGIPYHTTIKTFSFDTILQYLTYNQTYYLINTHNNKIRSFSSLAETLKTLGTLSHFHLADLSELYSYNHYFLQLRSQLNTWQLPPPLILEALINSDWQIDSGWQRLNLQRD